MAVSWPFRRHAKWQQQLDAYIDRELDPGDIGRFELHLQSCAGCESELAARRELKRMAAAVPQLPAPRSFRITPGMLVEQRRQEAPRRAPVAMRFAQVTAGVATLAFASVLVADLSQGGGASEQQASGNGGENTLTTAESAQDDAVPPQPTPQPVRSSEEDDDGFLPDVGDGVAGAGAVPSPADGGLSVEDVPAYDDGAQRDYSAPGNVAIPDSPKDGPVSSVELKSANEDSEGFSTLLAAEIGFATLAVVAALAWLSMRQRRSA